MPARLRRLKKRSPRPRMVICHYHATLSDGTRSLSPTSRANLPPYIRPGHTPETRRKGFASTSVNHGWRDSSSGTLRFSLPRTAFNPPIPCSHHPGPKASLNLVCPRHPRSCGRDKPSAPPHSRAFRPTQNAVHPRGSRKPGIENKSASAALRPGRGTGNQGRLGPPPLSFTNPLPPKLGGRAGRLRDTPNPGSILLHCHATGPNELPGPKVPKSFFVKEGFQGVPGTKCVERMRNPPPFLSGGCHRSTA